MARSVALLILLPTLAGCGLFATGPAAEAPSATSEKDEVAEKSAKDKEDDLSESLAKDFSRGDFVVQRFSGEALEAPIELTERIVEVDEAGMVVDYKFVQAEEVAHFRVHFGSDELEPKQVFRLAGDKEIKESPDAFDAWMQKTVFAADSNDGKISEEEGTCLLGSEELDCSTISYRVYVGDVEATLSVTNSVDFANRDLAGSIVDEAGRVLYEVRTVDAGNNAVQSEVARRD